MKLSELIAAVGDDNVIFQNLQECVKRIDKRKGHTEIAFGTNAISAEAMMLGTEGIRETGKVCFIVWLPADKVDAAIKRFKEGQ